MKKTAYTHKKFSLGSPKAVIDCNGRVGMLVSRGGKTKPKLSFIWSTNGIDFATDGKPKNISIKTLSKKTEKLRYCDNFLIKQIPGGFLLTYIRHTKKEKTLVIAQSKDLFAWTSKSEIPAGDTTYSTVIYNEHADSFEMYRDGLFIRHQGVTKLSSFQDTASLLFTSRFHSFDALPLSVLGSTMTDRGILVVYDASLVQGKNTLLQVGAVLFDVSNPKKIIWRSEVPIWQGVAERKNKITIRPLGFVEMANNFLFYFVTSDGALLTAVTPALFGELDIPERRHSLKKSTKNPIITPRHTHDWEVLGTFNPAVYQDDDGSMHLFYRALGHDGISRVGYAKSNDGLRIDYRSPYPVFEPYRGYRMPDPRQIGGPTSYNPAVYTSGGGWGGAEDPRIVRIGDRLYMIYVAFEGWYSVRIALTSISLSDFRQGKWKWREPVLLSSPNEVNKNWVLFPEKINGKYAILHGIAPEIMIEYVDNLHRFDTHISSPRKAGPQPGREEFWDNLLRGVGPPPIKTELGWLVLYHAIDKREPMKYKLGAMILDSNDPSKVLYRGAHPILYPEMWYENEGKPGIVYASGAVVRGDELFVYYGGGDRVVCVATTPLSKLLNFLTEGSAKDFVLDEASLSLKNK